MAGKKSYPVERRNTVLLSLKRYKSSQNLSKDLSEKINQKMKAI